MNATRVAAALLLGGTLAGCDGGAAQKQAEACAAAWNGALAAVQEQSAALEAAEPVLAQRRADAQKAAAAAEKRLAALTIRREEASGPYADRIKARVASAKMRLGTIQAGRELPGKPLSSVTFDAEIQGDYRAVRKTVTALYDQPKAFFLDRVEVNITDERKRWALMKVEFHVHELAEGAPPAPAEGELPEAYAAALAWAPDAACASATPPEGLDAARERLRAQEAVARRLRLVERLEENVKARTAIADDLVRRRDDDRAMWTAHADSLVEKAKTSVTGLAELRFDDRGEPDWKM